MLMVFLLLANLLGLVTPFQPNTFRIQSISFKRMGGFQKPLLQSSHLNSAGQENIVDVDSSVIIPCLDQWLTFPCGEIMGIVYHSDSDSVASMYDGDIIATSAIKEDDLALLQEGMNVATISGTQYTLLNRANVEMAQHYNILLENHTSGGAMNESAPPPNRTSSDTPASLSEASSSSPWSKFAARFINQNSNDSSDENQDEVKQLLQQVKDAGVSGAISYALWELAFWALSVPVCLVAYQQVTGHWPDFSSSEDWKQLGTEGFVFVNVARFAVPVRIGLALSTVPWVQANLVERFSYKNNNNNNDGESQLSAMEEYQRYQQERSLEMQQQFGQVDEAEGAAEATEEEPQMSAMEEYQQYQEHRSPELHQQFGQYQQQSESRQQQEQQHQQALPEPLAPKLPPTPTRPEQAFDVLSEATKDEEQVYIS